MFTYGLTKSLDSPVNAFLTFAISDEFIRGKPSARYTLMTNLARCRSSGTPSGSSRFLPEGKLHISLTDWALRYA